MKIGIYDQNAHSVVGGSEYFVATVADYLCRHHEVDLIHHKPNLTAEHLRTLYGTKLDKLRLHYVPPENSFTSLANPWRRYTTDRARYSSISRQ